MSGEKTKSAEEEKKKQNNRIDEKVIVVPRAGFEIMCEPQTRNRQMHKIKDSLYYLDIPLER
jgi:hypothetical protein